MFAGGSDLSLCWGSTPGYEGRFSIAAMTGEKAADGTRFAELNLIVRARSAVHKNLTWAYPDFVDRLVFESGDGRLASFELNGSMVAE